MNEIKKDVSMGFTNEGIPEWIHVCLIYDNQGQHQKTVSEYMAPGLQQGELVRYFTDTTTPEDVNSWLLEMGIDIADAMKNNSFSVSNAQNFYCSNGHFEPQKILTNIKFCC